MTNFNYDEFKNKTGIEARKMVEETISTEKLDPVLPDGFSLKFMNLILAYDKMHTANKIIKPFIFLYYKIKKASFMLNFSQRTIDAKIFCIENLNKFLFYDRECLQEIKTPRNRNVKIMASKDFIIIKQLIATGREYTLIMDFTKRFGYTVGERVSLYYTNGNKVTSCNVFDLQYENLIDYKTANSMMILYLEKVVNNFECRNGKNKFSFYKRD